VSKIRSKNTKIEKLVFRELRRNKIYFYKHYKSPFGSIDVALPKKKKAIFIDGTFWHGYNFKKLKKRLPGKFWIPKIERNIKRDRRIRSRLKRNGWVVLRIWEYDIEKKFEKSFLKIRNFLN